MPPSLLPVFQAIATYEAFTDLQNELPTL